MKKLEQNSDEFEILIQTYLNSLSSPFSDLVTEGNYFWDSISKFKFDDLTSRKVKSDLARKLTASDLLDYFSEKYLSPNNLPSISLEIYGKSYLDQTISGS